MLSSNMSIFCVIQLAWLHNKLISNNGGKRSSKYQCAKIGHEIIYAVCYTALYIHLRLLSHSDWIYISVSIQSYL